MEDASQKASVRLPNLFDYATSELSQDAFICWLLKWASSEFSAVNPKLNACGVKFVDALFERAGKTKPERFDSIEVKKQVDSIDVLVVLKEASGGTYAIIIEDKTDTKHHSGQLERYYKIVRDKFKIPEHNIIPIYLKTGDQSSYIDVNKSGFCEFLRKDFLSILRDGKSSGIDNDIFCDFFARMEKIEYAVNRYRTEDVDTWVKVNSHRTWSGLFTELKKEIEKSNWEYVPNQSGGFMCFWWGVTKLSNVTLHLHLAERQLRFKIEVTNGKPSAVRNEWQKRICNAAKNLPTSLKIGKPARFGSGKHMTVAVLNTDYFGICENNILNIPETVKIMKQCEDVLNAAISGYVDALPEAAI